MLTWTTWSSVRAQGGFNALLAFRYCWRRATCQGSTASACYTPHLTTTTNFKRCFPMCLLELRLSDYMKDRFLAATALCIPVHGTQRARGTQVDQLWRSLGSVRFVLDLLIFRSRYVSASRTQTILHPLQRVAQVAVVLVHRARRPEVTTLRSRMFILR